MLSPECCSSEQGVNKGFVGYFFGGMLSVNLTLYLDLAAWGFGVVCDFDGVGGCGVGR